MHTVLSCACFIRNIAQNVIGSHQSLCLSGQCQTIVCILQRVNDGIFSYTLQVLQVTVFIAFDIQPWTRGQYILRSLTVSFIASISRQGQFICFLDQTYTTLATQISAKKERKYNRAKPVIRLLSSSPIVMPCIKQQFRFIFRLYVRKRLPNDRRQLLL